MRIAEIMHAAAPARKRSAWTVYLAAILLAAPLSALQVAIAQTNGHSAQVQTAQPGAAAQARPLAAASAGPFSVAPLIGDVTSAFGQRTDPNRGGQQFHSGVDFRAPEGAEIVAPAAGRVTRVALNLPGWGNLLEIDHGGGLATRYAHLQEIEVSQGQQVTAGQFIARAGNTGLSNGPHLHFEVLRDGQVIDPETVLPPRQTP